MFVKIRRLTEAHDVRSLHATECLTVA